MTIKVGINLLWLVPGEVGGSEESTVASLLGLAALAAPDLDVVLFVSASFAAAYPEVVAAFPTRVWRGSGRSRARRILAESTWLAGRSGGLDVIHHAGGTVPLRRRCPCVVTLHDLQPLERRATHGAGKRAYLRMSIPASVRAARLVITPSEFVRRSLISRFDTDPAGVVAVPHGVGVPPVVSAPADVINRYSITGPMVLYPAITYPHKNHRTLLEAFAVVVVHHPDAILVLPGGQGSEEAAVRVRTEALGLSGSVRRVGRISSADLAGLYGLATVVAVPSRYEGFGLPAVEAMAHGVALVAANVTALAEVVGDAGVLVDPDDPAAWARAISALLAHPDQREELAEAGRHRADRYGAEANAEGMAGVYRRAARMT
ncbi:MAG: glycosyltransferase family 1 protein [Acidimicrobiia bacterium]|nr:glycosyltransferase family 1 protein [Acidimicrobiia bacterium]